MLLQRQQYSVQPQPLPQLPNPQPTTPNKPQPHVPFPLLTLGLFTKLYYLLKPQLILKFQSFHYFFYYNFFHLFCSVTHVIRNLIYLQLEFLMKLLLFINIIMSTSISFFVCVSRCMGFFFYVL